MGATLAPSLANATYGARCTRGGTGRYLARDIEPVPRRTVGSAIAIDLLDHLTEALRVRRFITIGSPANIRVLHEGTERLLKTFPY